LKALIFDSTYDAYRGIIVYVRRDGRDFEAGMTVSMMGTGEEVRGLRDARLPPQDDTDSELRTGESGYIIAGIKDVVDVKIGDTVTRPRGKHGSSAWISGA
jgi:GTP-binding protein LepA